MMSMFWYTASAVPAYHCVFGHALAGRQDVEAFVAFGPQEVPAALQVADQRMRLVLRGDADAADAGIERIRQREIDDPRLAAEIDRRLGAPVGQFLQAAAAPAGQHIGHGVAGQRLRSSLSAIRLPPKTVPSIHPSSSMIVASGGSVTSADAPAVAPASP